MKQVARYTPGPWKLCKNAHGWFLKTKDGCIIGGINRFPETAELAAQCEPNARLIAAAPELLEALQSVAAWCASPDDGRTTSEIEDVVFAALAKARAA